MREAWRLALFGVLAPLGRLVESELKAKLDDEVSLSWQELRASDLSGRARAFQSMVGGGMDISKAIAGAGLMVERFGLMRRAANLIERWQRFLTAEQVEEISNHLEGHQAVIDLVAPRGGLLQQIHYDDFFLRAREVKWLEF